MKLSTYLFFEGNCEEAFTSYERILGGKLTVLPYEGSSAINLISLHPAEGGQVKMPIAETFWAQRFGMLVDRFGTSWMVSGANKPM